MIAELFRLSRSGTWRAAERAELPAMQQGIPPVTLQLLVLAGGLALTLSRCSEAERRTRFARTAQLYELLHRELRAFGRTTANASLLMDAFHETSEHIDPATRQAFHKCLEARHRYESRRAATAPPQEFEMGFTTMLPSTHAGASSVLDSSKTGAAR